MRKFDLELAKAGYPVCTRDGKPVRIICFDVKGTDYPIVAAIMAGDVEYINQYPNSGKYYADGHESPSDLMMVSEVEESEDEKIRKDIISFLKEGKPYYCPNSVKRQKWVAWLEEQGEQKSETNFLKFRIGDKVTNSKKTYTIDFIGIDCYWLKEDCATIPFEYQHLWKLVEQNHADKVEPKFKVGDWIMSNVSHEDYRICKILKIENGEYVIESIYGYKGHNNFETFDKDYHLWTIQDAKDGDILVDGYNNIGLYNKEVKGNFWNSYIYLGWDNHLYDFGGYHDLKNTNKNTKPATKEQRDLLFQRIKEAGYEWDAEKKELKKIEQKSTWSEEDEKKRKGLIKGLEDRMGFGWACDPFSREEYIDWLKSLKERYTWKPSEEQIQALEYQVHSTYEGSWQYKASKELLEQLKKL